METTEVKSLAETMVTVNIPDEIRSAHRAWLEANNVSLAASDAFRAVQASLGLDKAQARELSHRMSEIASRYGYDDDKEYKYLKAYGMKYDAWNQRKVPHITMEWIEARHTMDTASHVASVARQAFDRYFHTPGFPSKIAEAYKDIVMAALKEEVK